LAAPRHTDGASQQLHLKLSAAAIAAGRVNLRLEAEGRVVGEASLAFSQAATPGQQKNP